MVTLNSEWHKFRSVRELWVGLGLALLLYGLLPGIFDVLNAAAWSWVGMLSYDWPRTVGVPLWAFPLYMLAVLAAELALVRLAWLRRDTH